MNLRAVLSIALGGLVVAAGLSTCVVQCSNHERAQALAHLQRQCEMVEAANAQTAAIVAAHIAGVPNAARPFAAPARAEVRE